MSDSTGAIAVAAGRSHTCAITDGGAVFSVGNNDVGQLGTTFAPEWLFRAPCPYALRPPPKSRAVAIAAAATTVRPGACAGAVFSGAERLRRAGLEPGGRGRSASHRPRFRHGRGLGRPALDCAQSATGNVVCWGYGGDGELGGGSVGNTELPQSLDGGNAPLDGGAPPSAVSLAGGAGNSLAITASGQALAWARTSTGQLGTGDLETRLLPTPITGSTQASLQSRSGPTTGAPL